MVFLLPVSFVKPLLQVCTQVGTLVPKACKIGLVSTLVHHVLMICSPSLLNGELARIQEIFKGNDYSTNVIRWVIYRKIRWFKEPVILGLSWFPIYLKLPWLGRKCQLLTDRILACVTLCYNAVKLCTVLQTRSAFSSFSKVWLSFFWNSSVIYKFKCHCDVVYIGWTNQRLEMRITQHMPTFLHSSSQSHVKRTTQVVHDSSIGQHWLDNPDCAADYNDAFFFHLT